MIQSLRLVRRLMYHKRLHAFEILADTESEREGSNSAGPCLHCVDTKTPAYSHSSTLRREFLVLSYSVLLSFGVLCCCFCRPNPTLHPRCTESKGEKEIQT